MNIGKGIGAFVLTAAFAAVATAGTPTVTKVTLSESDGTVTIGYTLSEAPAIVTLDIKSGGESIGGRHIQSFSEESDVWRRVTKTSGTIVWYASKDWPGHTGELTAEVTAWPTDASPDYMVVDITKGAQRNSERYYPSAEFLPGGLLANPAYRTSSIVMRRIAAKGATCHMGTTSETGRTTDGRETPHEVTLTNDYYIGVFEVTQAQWLLLGGRDSAAFKNGAFRAMRPMETVRYAHIRSNDFTKDVYYSLVMWPAAPYGTSYLGKLRDLTGLSFDLPSEAQWEFAARAGQEEGHWGDGSLITGSTSCDNLPGRYKMNGGYVDGTVAPDAATCPTNNGTAVCGSYAPNAFGLYDMNGNVWELCLDYYESNLANCDSQINMDPEDPLKAADGTVIGAYGASGYTGTTCWRGGAWDYNASYARAAFRGGQGMNTALNNTGFRLYLPAGGATCFTGSGSAEVSTSAVPVASAAGAVDGRECSWLATLGQAIDTFKAGIMFIVR